ncbi:hypothetical protein [Rhodococcus sp. 27YEA15]|uniref:hypothetical protein n=1 Tax=Rhodococcus sp. 27YEA15 TaxID=3156259 RepID=UPI003C7BB83D
MTSTQILAFAGRLRGRWCRQPILVLSGTAFGSSGNLRPAFDDAPRTGVREQTITVATIGVPDDGERKSEMVGVAVDETAVVGGALGWPSRRT